MTRRSIRLRLAAWYLSVLLTALVLFGVGIWVGLRYHLTHSLEETLADRTDGFVQFLEIESHGSGLAAIREETREYTSGLPEGDTLRLYGPDGIVLFESPATHRPAYMHREVVSVHGYALSAELGTPLAPVNATLDSLRGILLASIPLVLVLAALGGWWLSRRALNPVDQMITAAESIGAGDLSARLDVAASGDEIERLGRAWNRMLGRIELSVKQVQQFTADAAHELRTPVAVIRTASELAVRRDRDAGQYRAALEGIQDEARRMSDLVDALLWLARNDASRIDYRVEDVAVADTISSACQGLRPLARACQVRMFLDAPANTDLRVRMDRDALRRVVQILTDNAVKFTPAGGSVRIGVSAVGSCCRVRIEDSGIGIDPEDLPHIFNRFYRGDRARHSPGSGLGLAIAAAIVGHHKGTIEAGNLSGSGAYFEVRLLLGGRDAVSDPVALSVPRA